MPNLIVSSNVDTMLGAADNAAICNAIGLGTTGSPTFGNLTLTSPSLASSTPVTFNQTWSTTGTYTAFKVNVTDSGPSSTTSNLLDLQVGGVSKFSVKKSGDIITTGNNITTAGGGTWGTPSAIEIVSGGHIRWSSRGRLYSQTTDSISILDSSATLAVTLAVDAANTLALRNGTNAQTFNVYGSYSGAGANYARLALTCASDGNATISTQGLGSLTAGTISINGVPVGKGKGNLSYNIAIGNESLRSITAGQANIGIGEFSLYSNLVASDNISIGLSAFYNLQSGSQSVAIGNQAGRYFTGSGLATVSNNSVYIGYGATLGANATTNEIVIGHNATGIGSNSVVLGNDSITKTALKGNVGIGTTSPGAKLEVVGGSSDILVLKNAAQSVLAVNSTGGAGSIVFNHANSPNLIINQSTGNKITLGVGSNNLQAANSSNVPIDLIIQGSGGNVGIGTTSPTSKLHVAGNSSPSITVDNTSATGASQLLFKNTVVTGDGFWLNGSAQTGYGGANSFNLFASSGPMAFHTSTVTNAVSIAQSGTVTIKDTLLVGTSNYIALGAVDNGILNWQGRANIMSPASAIIRLVDNPRTNFNLLQFGGASGFPGLKKVGAELQVVIASTSAAIDIAAGDADLTFIEDRYRRKGTNSPEGVVTAPIGAVFHRTDGGANTSFYVKESGTGNTGWVAK